MITVLWILVAYGSYLIGWQLQLQDPDQRLRDALQDKSCQWQHGLSFFYLVIFWSQRQQPEPEVILQAFEVSALLLAAWIDHYVQSIPDMIYVPGFAAGIAWIILQHPSAEIIGNLIIFVGLQAVIYRRLYGESDCIAYSLCALYLAGTGGDLLDDLLFMLLTVGIEAVVQISHHNLDFRHGRLIRPVALIPYMAVSMLLWILLT